MNELLVIALVLALLILGPIAAAHIMGWLMEHRLLGVAIVVGTVYWLIVDLESALWMIVIAVTLLTLFAPVGREGQDRAAFHDDDAGG